MLRFLSKKLAFVLAVSFTLWIVPPQVYAQDDPQKVEDAQKLSNTLLIVGLSLAIAALVLVVVQSSMRSKPKPKKELEKKKEADQQKEVPSDSTVVNLP